MSLALRRWRWCRARAACARRGVVLVRWHQRGLSRQCRRCDGRCGTNGARSAGQWCVRRCRSILGSGSARGGVNARVWWCCGHRARAPWAALAVGRGTTVVNDGGGGVLTKRRRGLACVSLCHLKDGECVCLRREGSRKAASKKHGFGEAGWRGASCEIGGLENRGGGASGNPG